MTGQTPPPTPPRRGEGSSLSPPSRLGRGAGGFGLPPHLCAFVILLSLWTWKLLEPSPVPEPVQSLLTADTSFFVAKCLHGGGYAFLTVLAATLPVSRRWRWGLVAFLALHGAATEFLQAVLPFNRTGRVFDVMIDWLGISLGLLVLAAARRGARRTRSPSGRG